MRPGRRAESPGLRVDEPPQNPPGVVLDCVISYEKARPIFVVGSVRSGTSAIMNALREGAGIKGFNEGNFAHMLPALIEAVERHFSRFRAPGDANKRPTMVANLPASVVINGIKNVFGAAFVRTFGEGRWLDKTPGGKSMVRACPVLLEIFPHARFIFCKRRGVENVLSRQRKFPDVSFINHCRSWADTMQEWHAVRESLGASFLEIDQRDMAIDPAGVASRVGGFIGLSQAEGEAVRAALSAVRLEQTRPVQDSAYIDLEESGWTAEEKSIFVDTCGEAMRAYDYPLGAAGAGDRAVFNFFVTDAETVVQKRNLPFGRKGFAALDRQRFAIYPNGTEAAPAAVCYRSIDMTSFRRFSTRIRIAGKAEGAVMFRVAIEDGSAVLFAEEKAITGEGGQNWRIELPRLSGAHEVVLSNWIVGCPVAQPSIRAIWMNAKLT